MTDQPEIPYRYPGTVGAGTLLGRYGHIQAGESSGDTVHVAGRIMRLRTQGRLAFAELRDWSGAIQLFADEANTEQFVEFTKLNLGDWIGATGEVMRTRRGELSVKVVSWTMLARTMRGFGDKWHGVNDPEIRYRQREVDLWANDGVRDTFLIRSRAISAVRRKLDELGFVEVETPVLQAVEGGAPAKPFVTHHNALHADLSLRISLELYLKRALVGGFERVFEIGRVFRNEGLSPRHNPEFTLLEAYQAYADYTDMMDLVENLVSGVALDLFATSKIPYQGKVLDLTPPWRRVTMEELVAEHTGTELTLDMGREELAKRSESLGVSVSDEWGAGAILLEIYEKTTEHRLDGPVHVIDYPLEVSPLARSHRSKPGYVERFESVVAGRELANAFSELTDPIEQRRRLEIQAARRELGDEEAMAIDEEFLRALEQGMPPTGGLGIGIDRLVMLLADQASIKEVVLFPALRPESLPNADRPDEDIVNSN